MQTLHDNLEPAELLRWVDDELKLRRLAIRYVNQYPDIHTFACQTARGLLKKLGLPDLDPEQVHWHRFNGGVSSPRTFSGWAHLGPPVESMTLVELMNRRFNVADQDNSDTLSVYQGFYSVGAGPGFFDDRNEIRLLPARLLTEFWALDFKALYLKAVDAFWGTHTQTFKLLAKTHRLAQAIRQRKLEGQAAYLARLAKEAPELITPVTMAQLQAAAFADPAIETELQAAKAQMAHDSNTLITSNADLRKQLWRGYLGAYTRVFGVFAPLSWPLALAAVGAGVARVGLDVDQAANGQTAELRAEGLVSVVVDSIFVLFNAPLLHAAGAESALLEDAALGDDAPPAPSIEAPAPSSRWPGATDSIEQGIRRTASNHTFITLDGVDYPVQFRVAQRQWCIVDQGNPDSWFGVKPVRYNPTEKIWEQGTPLNLAGGMEQGDEFWDLYTQVNRREQLRLSRRALERQRETLQHLPAVPEATSSNEDEYVDPAGIVHSVFQTYEGEFRADQISAYTEASPMFNNILRFEAPVDSYAQNVWRVEELADQVQAAGSNNAVDLYRAGSGTRGTSGAFFRDGRINVGDLLVNTDITSFSENPYIAARFASTLDGAVAGAGRPMLFDDTSVVFVLRAGRYLGATPIAPFSEVTDEAESIMLPGHHFQIGSFREVQGTDYRFILVDLHEVLGRQPGQNLFELRTGLPFSPEAHAARLSPGAQPLVARFFTD